MPIAPDLAGSALDGRYELHALIGEGGFGRVYRGVDRRLARTVAIKVIKPWWADEPDWARRFERETQLLAHVSDPGIVQIFDVGHAPEGLYYVAEYVDGESLAGRLGRGPVPAWEACEIAEQLCRALAHAHERNIVHRDIKPANILISASGRVKVGDFGVARLTEGTSEGPATVVGTPRYMAPEQARGLPTGPATDIYSAGIVLYEMLAGQPPFAGGSPVELALHHLNDPPPPLPAGTPPALRRIAERALAKNPEARYRSAEQMLEALVRARGKTRRSTARGGSAAPTSPRSRNGDATAATGRLAVRRPVEDPKLARTRIEPRRVRRNVNPSARRQSIAMIALVLTLLLAMIAAAILLGAAHRVRVPRFGGLDRGAAVAAAKRAGLHPAFSERYGSAKRGAAIAQTPVAGARINSGSVVRIVLSAGPRPVEVPQLLGQTSGTAESILGGLGLSATVTPVPAPGVSPGIVTEQSPSAARYLPPHSRVALSVAETPRWRPLTGFAGHGSGRSVAFRIRGSRWRVLYSMHYVGTCTFIFFCSGPNAQVVRPGSGSTAASFSLGEGDGQTQVFQSGPGIYEVAVAPGSDTAQWSIEVEDYY